MTYFLIFEYNNHVIKKSWPAAALQRKPPQPPHGVAQKFCTPWNTCTLPGPIWLITLNDALHVK